MKVKSNKTEILIAIIAVFSLTFFIFFYQSYQHTKIAFENVDDMFELNIDNLFEEAATKMLKKSLEEKSKSLLLLLEQENFLDMVEEGRRDEIFSLLKPKYDLLKKELPKFHIMTLHDMNGVSILRMHAKSLYGDDSKVFRPHIKDIVSTLKESSFYEVGKHGLYYRHVTPLYNKNCLVGFFEVGMRPTIIIDKIEKVFGAKGYIFAKDNSVTLDVNSSMRVDNYILCKYCMKKDDFIVKVLPQLKMNKNRYKVKLNDKTYRVINKPIYNGFKTEIAKMLQFKDVTFFQEQLSKLILNSVILYIVSIVIIYLVFSNYIGTLLQRLNESDSILKKQNSEMKRLSDLTSNLVLYTTSDLDGNITYASKAFEKFTGYSSDEIVGKNHRIFKHKEMSDEFFENMWSTIAADKQFKGEVKNRRKDGNSYWTKLTIDPIFDENGKKVGYASYREDITDKKELEYISTHDKLTKLYNRYELEKNLHVKFKSAVRYGHKFGYIMFDIDHFKSINDKFGHHTGDLVLRKLSDSVRTTLREDDFIARWGGEEFVIITVESTVDELVLLVKKLQKKIASISLDSVESITVSFGLTIYKDGDDENSIQLRADKALYKAKENGRDRYEIL